MRLSKQKTISETEMGLLEAEKNHWRDVLTLLIGIIQSLAERNLALRGSVDTLYQANNGNVFGNVEKMYTLFSGSPQRWAILKKRVNITLKSETQRESRVKSIEPLCYQADKARGALLEVRGKNY